MMKKTIFLLTAVMFLSVLTGGCAVPDSPVMEENNVQSSICFAEQLIGRYRNDGEENGETVLEIYWIDGALIAEAEQEYAAYFAAELIPDDPAVLYSTVAETAEFTVYAFSGFSNFGEYWEETPQITIMLTDTGFNITDENGDMTVYIQDEKIEPIHIPERYDWFLPEIAAEIITSSLIGQWTTASNDGYTMFLQLDPDGSMIYCCKKEGEPISVHIGVAVAEHGMIKTVTEKVGWAEMPWQYDIEYTFDLAGTLILKNPEFGGLLPDDEAVGFMKLTDKE